jgi:hypothetical protein
VQERRAWGKGAYLYTDVGDASGEMQWRDAVERCSGEMHQHQMQVERCKCKWSLCTLHLHSTCVPCKNKHNHDICIKTSVLIPCCQMGCMFCINFVTSDSLLKLIVCIVYCFLRSGGKKLGNVSMLIKTVSF